MSQEYVERVRSAYEAFDEGGVEAILDRIAPDLKVRGRASAPDRETMVGGEGIAELVRLNLEVFDSLELEPVEFIDRGETIVVVLRQRVTGRASGVPLESETVHVWDFKEGRANQMRIFADRERALEALDSQG
jgi:ketosteroid isomerase-like protein